MNEQPVERRLSAILAADVVGYSRLMGADEVGTLRALQASRREAIDPAIAARRGRIFKTTGDGFLAAFASAVDAVAGAIEMQRAAARRNTGLPDGRRLVWRVGINVGDVLIEGDDIFGDGVNVAARLEAMCAPGGLCISRTVRDQVRDRLPIAFDDLGEHAVKNIARPVHAYGLSPAAIDAAPALGPGPAADPPRRRLRRVVPAAAAAVAVSVGIAWWLLADRAGAPPAPPADPPASLAVRDPARASIAVLPFAPLDDGSGYFADGLTEDVIAALGRFSELSVIARAGAFAYKGRHPSPEEVGRDLKVRYLVEGSVRRTPDRLRVMVSLTDTARGTVLWSERYDAEPKDIFAVQDGITRQVSGALAVRVTGLELVRSAAKPPSTLEAYDLVLRGRDLVSRIVRSSNAQARDLFERAIALDPSYAPAHVGLSRVDQLAATQGWTADPSAALVRAERHARRAIDLDEASPGAHAMLANVLVYFGNYDAALDALNRAIEFNPSDADAYSALSGVMLWRGDLAGAIDATERLLQFKPLLTTVEAFHLGTAYLLANRPADAVRALRDAAARNPAAYHANAVLAAAYAAAGQDEDAARQAEIVQRRFPAVARSGFGSLLRDDVLRARLNAALERAGI